MTMDSHDGTRRAFLTGGLAAAASALILPHADALPGQIDPDEGVTAPEDLMKEHGVLNRCLLIYEEGIRRIGARQDIAPEVFSHTADLVRRFVEQYHEKNEEDHIFPVFVGAKKLTDLVET